MKYKENIGIDLGASGVRICHSSGELLMHQSALLARSYSSGDRRVICRGEAAEALALRAPGSADFVSPLVGKERLTVGENGKINVRERAEATIDLLSAFAPDIDAVRRECGRVGMVLCIEDGASAHEEEMLLGAAANVGLRSLSLCRRSAANAAAVKAASGVEEECSILLDIGCENSTVALIEGGAVKVSGQIAVGGRSFDACIDNYLRTSYGLSADIPRLEQLKAELSVSDPEAVAELCCYGADSSIPDRIIVSRAEISGIFDSECDVICNGIAAIIRRVSEETRPLFFRGGIHLVGGGSLLPAVSEYITAQTSIRTVLSPVAPYAAAYGAALIG